MRNFQTSFLVTHIVEDMDTQAGGLPAVVSQLSAHLAEKDVSVEIIYAHGGAEFIHSKVLAKKYKASPLGRKWFYSNMLRNELGGLSRIAGKDKFRILHIHGIWSAPQFLSALYALKKRIPFVFTAHGMLDPWLWKKQGIWTSLKKRLYWNFLIKRFIQNATIVHAITPLERQHLIKLFPNSRIEIIPNAIDIIDYDESHSKKIQRKILYLGRIEPKKGVDILLYGFSKANLGAEWMLEIVGPVWSQEYMQHLLSIIDDEKIQDRVTFTGPIFGPKKREKILSSWILVAPSHSEAIGLVNLEAASLCVPTITTYQTGLSDWEDGGGVLIEPDKTSLSIALRTCCAWSYEERIARGVKSRQLVNANYSWDAMTPKWIKLYESILE